MEVINKKKLEDLIKSFKKGNVNSFNLVYDMYYPRLLRYAFHRTLNLDISYDIVSNVFCSVIENIHKYGGGNFNAWIYKITTNEIYMYFRKGGKYMSFSEYINEDKNIDFNNNKLMEDIFINLEDEIEKNIQLQIIKNAMSKIGKKYEEILVLYYWEEMEYQEIAEILLMKVQTVRKYASRGLEMLRNIIINEGLNYKIKTNI